MSAGASLEIHSVKKFFFFITPESNVLDISFQKRKRKRKSELQEEDKVLGDLDIKLRT